MGVDKLFTDCYPSIKKRRLVSPSSISQIEGMKRIGIDASIWLHQLCEVPQDWLRFHIKPFYPPIKLLEDFDKRINRVKCAAITPVVVFDGQDHPMKSATRSQRLGIETKAKNALTIRKKREKVARH